MQVTISISFDIERDAAILARIAWLKANRPRQVSAWVREMIAAGMARETAQEQMLERIMKLLESGAVVHPLPEPASDGRQFDALDKLGL